MKNTESWNLNGNAYADFLENYDNRKLTASKVRELCLYHRLKQRTKFLYGNVLDAGCGSAELLGQETVSENLKIFGVDISKSLLDRAKDTNVKINFVKGDLEKVLPFPSETFDFVVSNLVIQWIEDIDFFISEIYRVCKPSSRVILTIQHPYFSGKIGGWNYDNDIEPSLTILPSAFKEPTITTRIGKNLGGEKIGEFKYFNRTISDYFQIFKQKQFSIELLDEVFCQEEILAYDPKWIRHVKVPAFILFELNKDS
jgi:ubiquinone/menaquinone biosynthesis C-methylase UbiE